MGKFSAKVTGGESIKDLFSADVGGAFASKAKEVLTSPNEGLLQLKSFDLKLGFQSRGFVKFGPVPKHQKVGHFHSDNAWYILHM